MTKLLRVFEHQRITTKEGRYAHDLFTKEVYNAFRAYHRQNEETPYFDLIDQGVKFKQYVGAIQVGETTIEVLPKAGKMGDADVWQSVLLNMLKKCHLLTAQQVGKASLKLKSNSILDLYFELFLNELDSLMHRGLVKKYQRVQKNVKVLKGSLQFSRNLHHNLIRKDRFFTEHSVYNKNHLANQILFAGLNLIKRICSNPIIKDRIGRLVLDFPEVSVLKVTCRHFDLIKYDRLLSDYNEALGIARLLLLNFRPDLKHGKQDLLAIMFDMNKLWEEYVYRVIKEVNSDWKVTKQNSKLFWSSSSRKKTIRPDIFLKNKITGKSYVIDTKWKVIDVDDPADNDLKQMYVYNHHWKSNSSMLLYPRSGIQEDKSGIYDLPGEMGKHQCLLGFVDVVRNGGLSDKVAQDIFTKMN